MLTSNLPPTLAPDAEQGTTLMELLVAMVAAIVVLGALLTILEFSVNQEVRVSDRVQSNRIGRTSMTKVVDALHSSCTGFGATAIQAPATAPTAPLLSSGPLDLWFLSTYGTTYSKEAAPKGVIQHDIHWEATKVSNTGKQLGTITDYRFPSQSGRSPEWKFKALSKANAEKLVLAENVLPVGGTTIFTYYKFKEPTSTELTEVKAAELPLSTATAATVAKVVINFTQAPENGDTREGMTVPFNDAVVLRFNPTETGPEAKNEPCA
jgi:hypothetical protein